MDEIIPLSVYSLDNDGRGIAVLPNGKKIFVPGIIPEEQCEARINRENARYAEGEAVALSRESESRCLPFGTVVPGCNLAHMTYEAQLEYKRNKVISCLTRIGQMDRDTVANITAPILPSPVTSHYRNHMQYRLIDGHFFLTGEKSLLPLDADLCPLEYSVFGKLRGTISEVMLRFPTNLFCGLVLRGSEITHEILIEFVSDSPEPHERIISEAKAYLSSAKLLSELERSVPEYRIRGITLRMSRTQGQKRTRSGKRVILAGTDSYREILRGKEFLIKAGSFFQVNIPQTHNLLNIVAEGLRNVQSLCDIYCGTGTIGLSVINPSQQLLGVEAVPEAVSSAKTNAAAFGIKNARFICRQAERISFDDEGLRKPIAAIIDPPRAGLDPEFTAKLLRLEPEIICYISCDPATLARDMKIIIASGKYTAYSIRPVDMFPLTSHVETVCLLSQLSEAPKMEMRVKLTEFDLTEAEAKATYSDIKEYVKEHTGLKVSSLYIAQVKQKYGIIERDCYNLPKSDDSRQPKCPEHKEKAIVEALKYFKMI